MFEHGKETFLAIDDVLGSGESVASEKRALRPHASCPRIHRILHVGQLARCHRSWTKCSRRADADSGDHLLCRQIQHPPGGNWRRECAQGSMMPSVLPHAWLSDFAEPHLDFIGDNSGENQILAAQTFALTQRERRRNEVAGMTWIGFPI